jgi:hypothetical protein
MSEKGVHSLIDGLENPFVRGLQRDCFLTRPREIACIERLPENPFAINVSVCPKRAVALENISSSGAVRT